VSGAASHPSKWTLSGRWIPEKGDAGQLYSSVAYWVTEDWSIGLDYRPLVNEANWTTLYRLISEDPHSWKPAIILGSTADDFTDGQVEINSRTAFVTVSKALPKWDSIDLTASPYAGAVWVNEIKEIRPLAGLNLRKDDWSILTQYSGTNFHLTLSYRLNDQLSLSALYWGLKYPGVSLRYRF